ncbi:MAG: ice-binding family protein [Bacteriovorax sp.]|nr:ice-binding family protein [Bacteriovorax sp.]
MPTMREKNKTIATFFSALYALFVILLLVAGCGKKAALTSRISGTDKIENPLPRKLKALNIGQADDFAILAYSSISSYPNSSINGKVGLLPGPREQIILDPREVVGGATDIIGSDDETTPINLLSNAKVDMVMAYKEAVTLTPDSDKIGLYEGKLGGKILSPGCYKWNGDLTINNDFVIEGTDTDVWIFKIPANFKVASGVHLSLAGGAQSKNIFWQIAGSAVLESGSVFAGTIIAQQSIEMKNHSSLTGRVFAKNGYINLNQATINKP